MRLTVKENEEIILTLEGQYIFIPFAEGNLSFYRHDHGGERFLLTHRSVYRVKEGELGRLILTADYNGEVEIISGWGDFIPPVEGQMVKISSMPSMKIEENQKVALSTPVAIAEGQKVGLSAPIAIADGQKVGLSAPVAIADGQKVALSAPVAVVRDVPKALMVDADELPMIIHENKHRHEIIIKAPLSNGAAVYINGFYEVDAGEKIKIKTTAKIELTGAEGDRVCVMELVSDE